MARKLKVVEDYINEHGERVVVLNKGTPSKLFKALFWIVENDQYGEPRQYLDKPQDCYIPYYTDDDSNCGNYIEDCCYWDVEICDDTIKTFIIPYYDHDDKFINKYISHHKPASVQFNRAEKTTTLTFGVNPVALPTEIEQLMVMIGVFEGIIKPTEL